MAEPEFYRDYGNPVVEKLARAVCRDYGMAPDEMVPESGYPDAALVPRWWKHQEFAAAFLSCLNELSRP